MFYQLMKFVFLGPLLRLLFRPKAVGLENVPAEGPAIIAGNHVSPLDTVLLPLVVPHRQVVFLAKAEYFHSWRTRWFFKGAGTIPVQRGGPDSVAALQVAVDALKKGNLIGIFPEGTRSPDGRMYRGRTGVARIALASGVPVISAALIGTFEAMPQGAKLPKPRRIEVRFGPPLRFDQLAGATPDRDVLRSVTDQIMEAIRALSGQEYVDEYASEVKKRLARGGSS
jgi:1-acyl-sn-glycerol-3-phosphate acyltransferase